MKFLFVLIYFVVITVLGFLSMGRDKYLAQTGRWRTAENILLAIAIIGGSIGSILGMMLFKHKTRHKKFRLGLPIIFLAQVVVGIVIACIVL